MARGNPDNLRAAARRKSEAATSRGELAIRQMVKKAEPITFRGVARTAGCSIDFLYNSTDLRHRIEHLRSQQQNTPACRAPATPEQPSENGIIRTLTAQLSELKQRHRTETLQLKAALAAAQGEILALKRSIPAGGAHPAGAEGDTTS
jgi:hypothetical protein